jgi:hypothetical protein
MSIKCLAKVNRFESCIFDRSDQVESHIKVPSQMKAFGNAKTFDLCLLCSAIL